MSFEKSINRILSFEGGLVDNPADPGGLTQWGISQRSYPNLDIRALTREQAIELYRRDFYDRIHGDKLPDSVAYQLLDCAVNSGSSNAVRMLQRAIGVADDGNFGQVSESAVDNMSAHDIVMRFLAERLEFMTRLKNWPNASRGWSRRIAQNLRYGADDV